MPNQGVIDSPLPYSHVFVNTGEPMNADQLLLLPHHREGKPNDAFVVIHVEMIEGPEAFRRFRDAAKKVLTVPKSAIPNPFGKRKPQKKKSVKA